MQKAGAHLVVSRIPSLHSHTINPSNANYTDHADSLGLPTCVCCCRTIPCDDGDDYM